MDGKCIDRLSKPTRGNRSGARCPEAAYSLSLLTTRPGLTEKKIGNGLVSVATCQCVSPKCSDSLAERGGCEPRKGGKNDTCGSATEAEGEEPRKEEIFFFLRIEHELSKDQFCSKTSRVSHIAEQHARVGARQQRCPSEK